jgi:hypothetical protein
MSISGTVVRNQSEEPETPRSSRSRLGIQEKPSNASLEDSAINLAEVMHMKFLLPNSRLYGQCIIIMHLRNICRQRLLYKLASERVMLEKDQLSTNKKRNHMNLDFLG